MRRLLLALFAVLFVVLLSSDAYATVTVFSDSLDDTSKIESKVDVGIVNGDLELILYDTGIVKNPSFETQISSADWNCIVGDITYDDWGCDCDSIWKSDGSSSLHLTSYGGYTLDRQVTVSQSIDFTNIKRITLDINAYLKQQTCTEAMQGEIFVAISDYQTMIASNEKKFKTTGGCTSTSRGDYYDFLPVIELDTVTGVHYLVLGLEATYYLERLADGTPIYKYYNSGDLQARFDSIKTWAHKLSGSVTSVTISKPANILKVTPTITATIPSGTSYTLQVSNNGGATWAAATSGVEHAFTSTGNQFKYKLTLNSNGKKSPTIKYVSFSIEDERTPACKRLAFSDFSKSKDVIFNRGGSNASTYIVLPKAANLTSGSFDIRGEQLSVRVYDRADTYSTYTPSETSILGYAYYPSDAYDTSADSYAYAYANRDFYYTCTYCYSWWRGKYCCGTTTVYDNAPEGMGIEYKIPNIDITKDNKFYLKWGYYLGRYAGSSCKVSVYDNVAASWSVLDSQSSYYDPAYYYGRGGTIDKDFTWNKNWVDSGGNLKLRIEARDSDSGSGYTSVAYCYLYDFYAYHDEVSYPTSPTLDIGNDQATEWSSYTTTENINYTTKVKFRNKGDAATPSMKYELPRKGTSTNIQVLSSAGFSLPYTITDSDADGFKEINWVSETLPAQLVETFNTPHNKDEVYGVHCTEITSSSLASWCTETQIYSSWCLDSCNADITYSARSINVENIALTPTDWNRVYKTDLRYDNTHIPTFVTYCPNGCTTTTFSIAVATNVKCYDSDGVSGRTATGFFSVNMNSQISSTALPINKQWKSCSRVDIELQHFSGAPTWAKYVALHFDKSITTSAACPTTGSCSSFIPANKEYASSNYKAAWGDYDVGLILYSYTDTQEILKYSILPTDASVQASQISGNVVTIEYGVVDSITAAPGALTTTNTVVGIEQSLQNNLAVCTVPTCNIPINVTSKSVGKVVLWNLCLNYSGPSAGQFLNAIRNLIGDKVTLKYTATGLVAPAQIDPDENYDLDMEIENVTLMLGNINPNMADFSRTPSIMNLSTIVGAAAVKDFLTKAGLSEKEFLWIDLNDSLTEGYYTPKAILPKTYGAVYWCSGAKESPTCQVINRMCGTPRELPCYTTTEIENKTVVYLEHLSGVGGADDVVPPEIRCDNCSEPKDLQSGQNITFFPNVSDAFSGVDFVNVCKDDKCLNILCSNSMDVPAGVEEERNCTYITEACGYGNVSYWIRASDFVSNNDTVYGGNFSLKKAEGCPCLSLEECVSASCIKGVCTAPLPPKVEFNISKEYPTIVQLGMTGPVILKLYNPLQIADTISIHLYGEPPKAGYWSWFHGHKNDEERHDLTLLLAPLEERTIQVEIYGAQLMNGLKLSAWAESSTTGLRGRDYIFINVWSASQGIFTRAPDLSWLGFIIVLFGAILLGFVRK